MEWTAYWAILRRRWLIVAALLVLDLLAGVYLFARSNRHVGYNGCITVYVADVSSPSMIYAPPTTLQTAGQLLSGETAANFFGDDILDVARSSDVASFVSRQIAPRHLPSSSQADINGAVSGSRLDRTVNLCVNNPNSATAMAASQALGTALTTRRASFIGRQMASRTYVRVISPASVARAPTSRNLVNLALRLILGLLVALGVGLLWDALDPHVRDSNDVEGAIGAPVLATVP